MISARLKLPAFIERAKTQTLTLKLEEDGAGVQPTSGTITIYDANDNAIVSAAAVVPTSTGCTYALAAASVPATLTYSDRWRIKWVLSISGVTETIWQQAHLVPRTVYMVNGDTDLETLQPELASTHPPDQDDWAPQLVDAWEELILRLMGDSRYHYRILSPHDLVRCHRALTLWRINRLLSTGAANGSRYATEADKYEAEYEKLYGQIRVDYDFDDDGKVSEEEEQIAAEPVLMLCDTPGAWPVVMRDEPDA